MLTLHHGHVYPGWAQRQPHPRPSAPLRSRQSRNCRHLKLGRPKKVKNLGKSNCNTTHKTAAEGTLLLGLTPSGDFLTGLWTGSCPDLVLPAPPPVTVYGYHLINTYCTNYLPCSLSRVITITPLSSKYKVRFNECRRINRRINMEKLQMLAGPTDISLQPQGGFCAAHGDALNIQSLGLQSACPRSGSSKYNREEKED